ncbi:MAG: hypothetical protein N3D85_03425 [Candidatus Bathyarchaeota archaeon]|nr:hypothetical protein [Candidatus Bathyarchaeota archaeon]
MVDKKAIFLLPVGLLAGVFAAFLFFDIGENRVAALTSIITANAAIIGFLAVVATLMLNFLQAELRHVEHIWEKLEEDYTDLPETCLEENTSIEYSQMAKRFCVWGFQRGWIEGTIDNTVIFSVASLTSFLVSIMAALAAMSNTPVAQYIGIYVSVGAFVVGNLVLFFILTRFRSFPLKNYIESKYDAKSH